MQSFTYDIDKGYTPSILSAVIGADSFFYGLFDENNNLYSCYYHVGVRFSEEYISRISEQLSAYRNIKQKVSFTTKPFLHLPQTEEDVTKYYPAFDDKMTNSEILGDKDVKVMYGLKDTQINFLEACFHNPDVHHISKVLSSVEGVTTPMLHAFVDEGLLHLIAHEGSQLKYYNQFPCEDKNDFLYFTMMMYNLLGYDNHEVPLHISGRVDKSSEIYELLYDYIKVVKFADTVDLGIVDVRFKDRKHYYYDLYRTAICES